MKKPDELIKQGPQFSAVGLFLITFLLNIALKHIFDEFVDIYKLSNKHIIDIFIAKVHR